MSNIQILVDDVIGGSAKTDRVKLEIDSFVGAILGNINRVTTIASESSERHACRWTICDSGDNGMDAICWITERGIPDIDKDLPVYDSSSNGARRLGMDDAFVLVRIRYSLVVLMKLALRIDPELEKKLQPFVYMNNAFRAKPI